MKRVTPRLNLMGALGSGVTEMRERVAIESEIRDALAEV